MLEIGNSGECGVAELHEKTVHAYDNGLGKPSSSGRCGNIETM
jgi:hypothetical protein